VLNGHDALVDSRPGVPLLTAGLVAAQGGLESFGPETLENFVDAKLDVLPAPVRARQHDYIARTATIKALDLTSGNDLPSQGTHIAAWVDSSFRAIAQVLHSTQEPPPTG
jgi:hypothetical protein